MIRLKKFPMQTKITVYFKMKMPDSFNEYFQAISYSKS